MRLRPRSPLRFLLALAAAAVLWYVFAGQGRESISVRGTRATLTLVNLPREMVLVSDVPDFVALRLRGPLATLAGATEGLEVLLDLADAQPGIRTLTIDPEDIALPPEVGVVSIDPPEVTLELERLTSRLLPVAPAVEGTPSPGFVVVRVTATPSQVMVRGPGTRLRFLTQVRTSPVPVDGATGPVRSESRLIVDDALVRPTTTEPVDVVVDIAPAPEPTPTAPPRSRRRSS